MTGLPAPIEDGFQVQAYPNPLTRQRVDGVVPAGASLADLLGDVHAQAWVNGDFVPREWWARCHPKAGTVVVLRAIPQGGDDKGVLRLIATLTLAVVAPWAGGALAGTLGVSSKLAVGALTVGVQFAGSLAINALIPPPQQARPEFSSSPTRLPSITSTRNRQRPFGNFVRYYGRHKAYPDAAAQPFTEVQGDDEYLRQIFCLGPGPLEITDIRIGETPIDQFNEVEWETREGWDDDPPLTLYAEGVNQTQVGANFNDDNDVAVRTVTLDEEGEVTLDLILPQGLAWYEKDGDDCKMTLGFLLEATETGTGNYTRVTEDASGLGYGLKLNGHGVLETTMYPEQGDPSLTIPENPLLPGIPNSGEVIAGDWDPNDSGTWTTVTTSFALQGKSTDSRRTSLTFTLPAGQYDIRLTRVLGVNREDDLDSSFKQFDGLNGPPIQSNSRGQVFEQLTWQTVRSITGINPVQRSGLALIAVRIKATDQLNNVIDELNCIVHSYLQVWNDVTEAWEWQKSSNPAWAYRDILTGSANARPIPLSKIDDDSIIEWAGVCDTAQREFNAPIEGNNVFAAARDVAAAGRAAFAIRGGKYGVVLDLPQDTPTQMFTARNARNVKGSRAFQALPHALKVKWVDPDADWQEAELIVYADGYDETTATRFETLELFGVTNHGQAWKDARYHLAVGKLRPETFEWETDLEYSACRRGNRVTLQHDALVVGEASGRLADVYKDDNGDVTAVKLDQEVTMVDGTDYALRIRTRDGVQAYGQLETRDGDRKVVKFAAPLDLAARAGDLWAYGELGKEVLDVLVKEVRPISKLEARIVAVPYAPAVYDADGGTLPDYDPQISLPKDPDDRPPEAPVIDAIQSDEYSAERNSDKTVRYRLRVAFSIPSSNKPRPEYIQAQIKRDYEQIWRTESAEKPSGEVRFDDITPGETYDVRVRSISQRGKASAWVDAAAPHPVQGATTAAPDVTGLQALGRVGVVHVSWDDLSDTAAERIEVWASTGDDVRFASVVGYGEPGNNKSGGGDSGVDHTVEDGAGHYYWARAINVSDGSKGALAGPVFAKPSRSPDYVRDTLTASEWAASTDYLAWQVVVPTTEVTLGGTVVHFQALDGGTSAGTEPDWNSLTAVGDTIVDNNITWEAVPRGRVPFVVGTIEGQPVVFMPGAYIGDLTVDTIKIKDNAITGYTFIEGSNFEQFNASTTGVYEIMNESVPTTGKPVEFDFGGEYRVRVDNSANGAAAVIRIQIRHLLDGVVVKEFILQDKYVPAGEDLLATGTIDIPDKIVPSEGAHDYSFEVFLLDLRVNAPIVDLFFQNAFMSVLELKK